jgi:hypothetical protein
MGVSTHIIGLKEPTVEYLAKLEAYRACENAGVEVPKELEDYFDGLRCDCVPDDGMEVSIEGAMTGTVEYGDGAIIDLSKLPEGVTRIRVYMG